jgi:integrase
MARRRYQTGCLFVRGKRHKMWVARWREDVILADNMVDRVQRSEVLGSLADIPSRREARKILEVRLRSINQGEHRPEARLVFESFVQDQWKPGVLPTIKASSAKHYEFDLERYLLPVFGPMYLCDITRVKVQTFLASKRQQNYAGSTVHSMHTTLSKVMQSAVDWGYLGENPTRGIHIGDRRPVRDRVFLMPPQIRQLLDVLPEPCRTLVLLAVLTGLRIGELLALRWKHADFLRGLIEVRESVYEGKFGTPKTRSSRRDVPMSGVIQEALLAHRARCGSPSPDGLLFKSRAGTPLNPKNLLRRVLQPVCSKAGLPLVSWHSFRHSHATLLSETGESLKTAQAILGHSHLETTLNVYTHAIPASQRRAVEKVGEILFPNVPKSAAPAESGKAN